MLDPGAPLSLAYLTYRGKPHVGGQGIYTRHLTKALVDLGHSVEVFAGQPYPVLDERIPLTKLPSLDLFNDHYPGRFPAYWEFKTRYDFLEVAQFSTGVFPEPLAFSARVNHHLQQRLGERFSAKRFHVEYMKQGSIPAGYFGEELLAALER